MKNKFSFQQKLSTIGRQTKRVFFWVPDVLSGNAAGVVGKTLRWLFALFLFVIVASHAVKSSLRAYIGFRASNKLVEQARLYHLVSEVAIEGVDFQVIKGPDGTRVGLQNGTGKWILPPEYLSLEYKAGLWICQTTKGMGLLDDDLRVLIPCTCERIEVQPALGIFVTDSTHVRRLLALDAKTELRTVCFSAVEELNYKTKHETNDGEGCRYYSSCAYKYYCDDTHTHCGLLSADGKVLTQPIYNDIQAVGPDLFLCLPQGDVLTTSAEGTSG